MRDEDIQRLARLEEGVGRIEVSVLKVLEKHEDRIGILEKAHNKLIGMGIVIGGMAGFILNKLTGEK